MHSRWILRTPSRYGFTAGLVLLFLFLTVRYALKVSEGPDSRSAILRWQNQVLDLWQGSDIWQKSAYPNPPIMAVLLTPFMHLPPLACSLAWYFVKAAMSLLAIFWVFRMVQTPERPFPAAGKALVLALSLRPIAGDLSHGNVNLLILFLVVASLYALHHARGFSAGLLLSLAVACKLTPALFIPYFLWKRAWRAVGGCMCGLVLFFGLVPGLFLGMSENATYLMSWTDMMVRPFVVDGTVTSEHNNQSLPGLIYRLASHSPSFSDDHAGYVPLQYHNLLDLDRRLLGWFLKGCMALFAVVVLWSCRTPLKPQSDCRVPPARWRLPAEFSVIVLGMLLFSERTWKHHCVTLLLPFSVIVYYLLACRPDRRTKAVLTGSLVLAGLLMLSTGTTGSTPEQIGKLAQVYGAYVWTYVLLLAALVVMLRQKAAAAYRVESYRVSIASAGEVFSSNSDHGSRFQPEFPDEPILQRSASGTIEK